MRLGGKKKKNDEMEMADIAQMCPDELRDAVVEAARRELRSRAEDGAALVAPATTTSAIATACATASAAAQHADASGAADAAEGRELNPTSSEQLEAIRRRKAEEVCEMRTRLVRAVCPDDCTAA